MRVQSFHSMLELDADMVITPHWFLESQDDIESPLLSPSSSLLSKQVDTWN